jgi:hypothetical protein
MGGAGHGDRRSLDKGRRAISGPLTPGTKGLSRTLTDSPPCSSDAIEARMAQLPKLIVRVRFPSPAPTLLSAGQVPYASSSVLPRAVRDWGSRARYVPDRPAARFAPDALNSRRAILSSVAASRRSRSSRA